jgi:hypothetical protein
MDIAAVATAEVPALSSLLRHRSPAHSLTQETQPMVRQKFWAVTMWSPMLLLVETRVVQCLLWKLPVSTYNVPFLLV